MNHQKDITQAEFERMEKYLLNQMAHTEKLNFEKELQNNPVLKANLEELKKISDGIEKLEFKETLNQFHREMEAGNKMQGKVIRYNWKTLLVAASVVIIAVISVLVYHKPGSNVQLFAKYYKTDPGLVTAMSSKEMNYEFDRGMVDYKSGEYQLAIDRWEPLLRKNPESDTLNYFLGTSYLEIKNTGKAIATLKIVTGNPQSKFINDSYWYLALAYLLEDKTDEALQALRKTNHPLKTELIHQLEEK